MTNSFNNKKNSNIQVEEEEEYNNINPNKYYK